MNRPGENLMHYMTFFKSRLQSIVIRLTCFLIFSCLLFLSAYSIPAGSFTVQASPVSDDTGSEKNLAAEENLAAKENLAVEENLADRESLAFEENLADRESLAFEEDLNIEDGTPGEDLSPEGCTPGETPDSGVFDENGTDETDPSDEYNEGNEENPGDEWPTTWPEDGITARIPRPDFDMDSLEVNICMENDFMGTVKATEEDYETYILSCKEYGFTFEEETHSSREGDFYSAGFSAFDIDGYKITVDYYSFNDPEDDFPSHLSIRIKAPVQLGTLNWPDHALGLLIPQPPTSVGGAGGDPEIFLRASLGQMSLETWREYVEACREAGFDQNISETEREYTATDEDGIRLTISYSGGNMVDLILFDPEQKWRSRGLGDSPAGGGEGEDGSGVPGEPDSPDPDSLGANEPEETDGPDGTENPDAPDPDSFGADETEETDGPDETENPDAPDPDSFGADETEETDEPDETKNPDETDKTGGIDDPTDADAANGTDNPGGTNKTPGENTGELPDSGASNQFDNKTTEENKGEMYGLADDSLNEGTYSAGEDAPMQDSPDGYSEYILDDQGSLIPEESGSETSNTPGSIEGPDSTESGQADFNNTFGSKTDASKIDRTKRDNSKNDESKMDYPKSKPVAKDPEEVLVKESDKKSGDNLSLIPADGRILAEEKADAQSREQYVQTFGQSIYSPLPASSTGSAYILSGPAARKLEAALRGSPGNPLLIRSGRMIRSGQYGKEMQGTGHFLITGRNSRNAHSPESRLTLPGEETRTAAALAGILAAASVLAGAVVKWRMFIRSLH